MVSRFRKLDHERGSLRLLLTLHKSEVGLTRQSLITKLAEQGVGKSALYSSLKACISLGLVEEYDSEVGSRRVKVTHVTEKGGIVTKKLLELKNLLVDG